MINIEDIVQIGGRYWNVRILSITEGFEIKQSDNYGRTIAEGAPEVLDPLGTYYTHTIVFARKKGYISEFDNLFNFVSLPRFDGVPVKLVHGQGSIEYEARFEVGERVTKRIWEKEGIVDWETFELKVIPIRAQVTA